MFKYDWSQFDAKTGLIFMFGVLLVFNVMGGSEFAWFAAGTSALLAWVTILLAPPAMPSARPHGPGGVPHDWRRADMAGSRAGG